MAIHIDSQLPPLDQRKMALLGGVRRYAAIVQSWRRAAVSESCRSAADVRRILSTAKPIEALNASSPIATSIAHHRGYGERPAIKLLDDYS